MRRLPVIIVTMICLPIVAHTGQLTQHITGTQLLAIVQEAQMMQTPQQPRGGANSGVVVSTHPDRGDYTTAEFDSDLEAAQTAYDDMVTRPDLPRTLILDAPGRPFKFDGYLDIWQSKCHVTSTGGTTIVPADGYSGPLIQTGLRDETELGEDRVISNLIMDNIWINGRNQSIGIRLRDIQMSTIHSIHVRSTDGPGLWVSDGCIENLFANLVLSDNCGSNEYPALLIEPESASRDAYSTHNLTVNSTQFSGIMIHFPTNDALRISAGPMSAKDCGAHRKIQFVGCYFHGHGRQDRPLVTIADAWEISFVGTQMLIWRDEGVVMQMGTEDAVIPTGITMISHCMFGGKPNSDTIGIQMKNVDTDGPCAAIFGNTFGTYDARLAHAVDWGDQEGKTASWAGNAVYTSKEPHIGVRPADADNAPF